MPLKKETIVSSNLTSKVVDINREPHIKIVINGFNHKAYSSNKFSVNRKSVELYIPLWVLPYVMREQRKAIAEWNDKQIEFIERIKKAYNTEIVSQ